MEIQKVRLLAFAAVISRVVPRSGIRLHGVCKGMHWYRAEMKGVSEHCIQIR